MLLRDFLRTLIRNQSNTTLSLSWHVIDCHPRRLDDDAPPLVGKTPQDYYRRQYFNVLDLLSEELTRRFGQKSLAAP